MATLRIFLAVFLGLCNGITARATPQVMRVEGSIFDDQGRPLSTSKDLRVKAYDAISGGNLLWTSNVQTTTISAGRFALNLNASQGSPSLVEHLSSRAASDAVYFEVDIDSGATNGSMDTPRTVLPRFRARGSAFALSAALADSLSGVTVTASEINRLAGVTAGLQSQLQSKLSLTGGTMSGSLGLSGPPTSSLDAATKAYVDASASGSDFQNVRSYLSGVTTTWTAPAGTTRIKVEVCGAGGSGGTGTSSCGAGGGGGGSGAMAWAYYSVTPGNSYTVIVGSGGTAPSTSSSGNIGNAGGSSSFDGAIVAGGGSGGSKEMAGGAGGSPSGSANLFGQGGSPGTMQGYYVYHGFWGGESPCGGKGGMPGSSYPASVAGGPGGYPGGGGGGGGCNAGTTTAPGAGAAGRVTIWY